MTGAGRDPFAIFDSSRGIEPFPMQGARVEQPLPRSARFAGENCAHPRPLKSPTHRSAAGASTVGQPDSVAPVPAYDETDQFTLGGVAILTFSWLAPARSRPRCVQSASFEARKGVGVLLENA